MSKPCTPSQIRNPATGRCVSKTGAIGKKLLDIKKPETPKKKLCDPEKIRNPATGRCVSKKGAIGKKLLDIKKPETPKKKSCPDDKIKNPATGRCVSKTGALGKKLLESKKPETPKKKPCPPGKMRNPATGRCINKPKSKTENLKQVKLDIEDKEDIKVFEKILNIDRKNPVGFICYENIGNLVFLMILKKYKSDCHYMKGRTLNLPEMRTQYRDILKQYEICVRNKKVLCIPFAPSPIHMNMLILNPYTETIELFEPHGNPKPITMNRINELGVYMRKNGILSQSKKIKVDEMFSLKSCPYNKKHGIQHYDGTKKQREEFINFENIIVKDPKGFCCMWSFLMMEFRLLYPSKSVEEFSKILTKKYNEDRYDLWRNFMRGYTYGYTEELKRELNRRLPKGKRIVIMEDVYGKYWYEILGILYDMKKEI